MLAITIDELKSYRETHNCGLYSAKQALLKEKMRKAIENAKTFEDFKPVLLALIDDTP